MLNTKEYTFWFVVGSQDLYGGDVLEQVKVNAKKIAESFAKDKQFRYKLVFKTVVTSSEAIKQVVLEANSDENCAGIVTWMHTFSPAKMWIAGLKQLNKPLLHLHTQFNVEIPWDTIDMDFMNLNQAAHGDREFGFIGARLRLPRKIIAGHWKDQGVRTRIARWMQSAAAYTESQSLKVARFGDNMRYVAVTEGDKVESDIRFGWTINTYPAGDLAERVNDVSSTQVNELMDEYIELYDFTTNGKVEGAERDAIREQARIEL